MRDKRLRTTLLTASVVGLSLLAAGASAWADTWTPSAFVVQPADTNDTARINDQGRLRRTEQEFTNEQAVVKFFGDGKKGLFVEMRTGALTTGATPVNRMQAACTPIELAQSADGKVAVTRRTGERFVTDNDGEGYRQANKPELMPINGGKNMLLMFNYRPKGANNTNRYAKVLDENCNEVPIKNANGTTKKQVLIMQKDNDNCDMHQTGEGPCDIASDAGGQTHLVCWAGCNGNGTDDGWMNDLTVQCENGAAAGGAAAGCTIKKNFDVSLCRREERSRGRCSIADEDPNTAVCTWTEGNTQPQRDGTWVGAVDISAGGEQGEGAQSRVLWKEQVDGEKEVAGHRTYSVRAQHTRVLAPRPDGTLERTNMLFFQAGDSQGRNTDNRKGGTYRALNLGVMKVTKAGMSWVVPLTNSTDMLLGIDGTHLTMCPAIFGTSDKPVAGFTLMQGSANGGGVTSPVVKAVAFDATGNKLVDLGTHETGGSYDRALYSQYLGENPNNQGRNFAGCTLVKNPFVGQNGSKDLYFLVHALTGKDPKDVMNAAIKPSSYVTLLSVSEKATATPTPTPTPTPPPTTGGTNPTPPTGATTGTQPAADPGTGNSTEAAAPPSIMGCAAAPGLARGGATGLGLVGLGLIVLGVRRKKQGVR